MLPTSLGLSTTRISSTHRRRDSRSESNNAAFDGCETFLVFVDYLHRSLPAAAYLRVLIPSGIIPSRTHSPQNMVECGQQSNAGNGETVPGYCAQETLQEILQDYLIVPPSSGNPASHDYDYTRGTVSSRCLHPIQHTPWRGSGHLTGLLAAFWLLLAYTKICRVIWIVATSYLDREHGIVFRADFLARHVSTSLHSTIRQPLRHVSKSELLFPRCELLSHEERVTFGSLFAFDIRWEHVIWTWARIARSGYMIVDCFEA
jgi:hypothetical protein